MKTNKILFASLLLGATLGTMTSCGDSFLDEKLITEKGTAYFKTEAGLNDLAIGTYQKLKFKFNYIWGINLYNMGVDEFTGGANDMAAWNHYATDLNSGETASNQPLWDNMYGTIEPANILIQNVPLYFDQKSAKYNYRLGEGYFFRAYAYFELVKQYGGVPLKLEPSTGVSYTFTRNSEEECFAQIISDFEKAYELLPETPEDKQLGRLTKSAAAHFLAKAHLFRASEPDGANEKVDEVVLAAQFSDNSDSWGRFGNQMHLYYPSVYQNLAGMKRDISGDREFCYVSATEYTMQVFDRVNDSRFWKSFITKYGCNYTNGAPKWDADIMAKNPDEYTADDKAGEHRFVGGQIGLKYIVNNPGDTRFTPGHDATGAETKSEDLVLKDGKVCPEHTFVRYYAGQPFQWNISKDNATHTGNYYTIYPHNRGVALSKFRDGARNAIASQFGTRDAIIARSADDVLMVAEAYIRKGDYTNAIKYLNMVRDRAGYAEGEDRSISRDGGQAYKKNTVCTNKGGGFSSEGAIYTDENTYFESNNIPVTTASTKSSMHLNSVEDILNSEADKPIYEALKCNTDAEKIMCFLLNERTRELIGESQRWEDLARTKTLEARWNAFNDGSERGIGKFDPAKHYYRPIPQSFLDGITNENGASLSDSEKEAMQNPGY